jgi:hypothetical protein
VGERPVRTSDHREEREMNETTDHTDWTGRDGFAEEGGIVGVDVGFYEFDEMLDSYGLGYEAWFTDVGDAAVWMANSETLYIVAWTAADQWLASEPDDCPANYR